MGKDGVWVRKGLCECPPVKLFKHMRFPILKCAMKLT